MDESKVISIGGKAKLKIHSIGKSNYKNRTKDLPKIIELVRTINPDVIRAYNLDSKDGLPQIVQRV